MLESVFEWDVEKERENIRIRGIKFADASDVFNDYLRVERHDDDSSENGGYTMAIVRYMAGRELTPDEQAARKARIEAASRRPYVYDPDCLLLTEKQLSEFKPVNFDTMEERARAMQNQEAPVLTSD